MKYLISILISTLLLTACQQEEQPPAKQEQAATEIEAKPAEKIEAEVTQIDAVAEHSHDEADTHEHAAAPLSKEPFLVVESKVECTKPVVIEFFAYHCPHCFSLEPAAAAWRAKNQDKVEFRSVPTDLGHQQFGSYLLVHHAAKALGLLEKTQHALFERFHTEKKLFASAEEATEFLVAQGADKAKAEELLNDPKLMADSIEADYKLLHDYQVASVPQVMVNHAYTTDITRAGGQTELFELVDELLTKPGNCATK